jgi:acetolactate decarboxylase
MIRSGPLERLQAVVCTSLLFTIGAGCTKTAMTGRAPAPQSTDSVQAVNSEHSSGAVTVHGALREIMHMGRTERQVDLAPLIGKKGTYGLGALEHLAGEVTLWDGQLWLSTPDGSGGAVSGQHKSTTAGAALLVTSAVTTWQERPITQKISFAQLDDFIEREARASELNVQEAFPFRIEGAPSRLDWHVIDGSKIPSDAHGHEAHMQSAVRGKLIGKPARIIGFYSPKHHAVFTHHDTNTHAHVICDDPLITGHVDHVDIGSGSTLFLPQPSR